MPEHSITVSVTTSSTSGNSPLLAAKHVDKIIHCLTKLKVTLIPELIEGEAPLESIVSDLVTAGFEPVVHRKSIPAPSMPPSSNPNAKYSPSRTTQRVTTTISSATTLMVAPGCYTLVVSGDDSVFIPIREHIDLSTTTFIQVNRTICRRRRLLVRYIKLAGAEVQNMKHPICRVRCIRTGQEIENAIQKKGNYSILVPMEETAFLDNIEIALVDRDSGEIKGVQTFDAQSGLRKIEESYLIVNAIHAIHAISEIKEDNTGETHHHHHHHHEHHKHKHHHHNQDKEEDLSITGRVEANRVD